MVEATEPPLDAVVRRAGVAPAEVARYYLRSELPNVLASPPGASDVEGLVDRGVAALSEQDLWRLMEAMSFRFRLNRAFTVVTDTGVDWHEVQLPLSSIVMTGVMPAIDDLVWSPEIDRDPVRFVARLREHFDGTRAGPRELDLFRPRGGAVPLDLVLLETEYLELESVGGAGRPAMLDGTFRLVEMALAGATTVRGYWAVPNGAPHRSMAGDSVFAQLRDLYMRHRGTPAAEAVLDTARLLAHDSVDGVRALSTYWVEHPRDEEVKRIGALLLASMSENAP